MGLIRHYILVDKKPVQCPDMIKWARWMSKADCRVARDVIGEVRISTVFLGINHQFGKGPPLFFETMLFDGPTDNEMRRCSTYEQAEAMHRAAVDMVREMMEESALTVQRASVPGATNKP